MSEDPFRIVKLQGDIPIRIRFWREPVDTVTDLPMTGNECGDARIVRNTNSLYVWDCDTSTWVQVSGGGGGATTFLELADTPSSYSGSGGKIVSVKTTEDGLEFIDPPSGGVPAGSDTEVQFNKAGSFGADPHFKYDYNSYVLHLNTAGYGPIIRTYSSETDYIHEWWASDVWLYRADYGAGFVNLFEVSDGRVKLLDGLIEIKDPGYIDMIEITSPPSATTGRGKLFVDANDHHIKFVTADGTIYDLTQGGPTTFLELTDTPASYTGAGGQYVRVKATEDGLEFALPPPPSAVGSDKSIQYNAGGSLAGDTDLVWDYTNKRLGVGVSTPSATLHVESTLTTPPQIIFKGTANVFRVGVDGPSNNGFNLMANGTRTFSIATYKAPTTTNFSFTFWNDQIGEAGIFINGDNNFVGIKTISPTEALQVGEAGDGTRAIANEWVVFSDSKIKEILGELKYGLQEVINLKPLLYRYKKDEKKQVHIGFVADDVEKVIPELVREQDNGLKSMNYYELIPVLVNAIKELKQKVDELEARLENCGC